MTLDESKASVLSGAAWGEVYPLLACDDDRAALREWFTRTPGVPTPSAVAARTAALAAPAAPAAVGYTGDCCSRCGSTRMQWAGACRVCLDCGESGGC